MELIQYKGTKKILHLVEKHGKRTILLNKTGKNIKKISKILD